MQCDLVTAMALYEEARAGGLWLLLSESRRTHDCLGEVFETVVQLRDMGVSSCSDSMVPWRHDTMVLWCCGAMPTWCDGATVPCYRVPTEPMQHRP